MKTLVVTVLFSVAAVLSVSCEIDIKKPSKETLASFTEMFPDAFGTEWERENGGLFKAEFQVDGAETEAWFSRDGEWQRTKVEVSLAEVPEAVRSVINDFADGTWETDEIDHYFQASGIPEYYRVEFDKENSHAERHLRVRPDGTVITDLR